jgi:hypothetical protein
MAAFEKITKFICPKCGRRGTARWEKNTSPLRHSAHAIHDLAAGFVAVDVGAKDGPRIQCAKCRVPAIEQ